MDAVAAVTAAAVKQNDAIGRAASRQQSQNFSVDGSVRSQHGLRKKSTRIADLLMEGTPGLKDHLPDLDAHGASAPDPDASVHSGRSLHSFAGGGSTHGGSAFCNNSGAGTASMAGGSMHGTSPSLARAMSGGGGGQRNWRKLNSAMVMTKQMASHMHGKHSMLKGPEETAEDTPASPRSSSGGIGEPRVGKFLRRCHHAAQHAAIQPDTAWYNVYWFYYAVFVALISCWVEPFDMAYRARGWLMVVEYLIVATFMPDFILKFFVAFYDPDTGMLVTTQPQMMFAYMKSFKFIFDLLGCFPYDMVARAVARRYNASDEVMSSLEWLKLLTLARAYRIFDLFNVLDYRMLLSQSALMILRNYTYVFFTAHWAACIFYHVAHQEHNFGPDSWVGRNAEMFHGRPMFEQYILSLYFSMTAFTAMGDANMYPFSTTELALMIVYLLFNLFLAAYIIGTVTIMMVTSDEHSKAFRDSMSHLIEYSRDNELPERLQSAMKEHLVVHFDSAQISDDQVLSIYPTSMRRRALRHLYLSPIKGCYLFRGCKQRFLDAILTAARVELFLPGVEIVTEGDNVVELLVVVAGEVAVSQGMSRLGGYMAHASSVFINSEAMSFSMQRTGSMTGSFVDASVRGGAGSSTDLDASVRRSASMSGGPPKVALGNSSRKGVSDALAEIAFFTDGASHETVVGTTPVRVLSLPKAAWELLVQQFPQQVRTVLENVQKGMETSVQENLKAAAARSQLTAEQLHVALSLVAGAAGYENTDPLVLAQTRDALTATQMEMITRLDDVRAVVSAHVRKCDEMRTFEFLNTASQGDAESLRTMLSQGISANTADYDGRTGLMLAAAKGHDAVVELLLGAGADKNKVDAFGISALSEAVKNAQDSTMTLLLGHGATLDGGGLAVAAEMCTAVFEGDLVKLRRLLRSGAPPDACDYDKRSALHIAGAEGSLEAVKLLVDEGGADPEFQDRWGNTALDEARRVGAADVVAFLESRQRNTDTAATAEKKRKRAAHDFLSWCSLGEADRLRDAGGYGAGDEAGCAFTGLLVAASKGHTDTVRVLLGGMPFAAAHSQAHVAMLEAARCGHADAVAAFRAAGVGLPSREPQRSATLRHLGCELRNAAQQGHANVVAALLAAGVSGRADGGTSGGSGGGAAGAAVAARTEQSVAEGNAPLHLAVEHSHLEVVRRLIEQGGAAADLQLPDGLGRTPVALAAEVQAISPSDPRVRAVHEYLVWAATAASRGLGMQQLASAALERWGPIVAPKKEEDDPSCLATPDPCSAFGGMQGGTKGLFSPMMDSKPGDRLLLPQLSELSKLSKDSTKDSGKDSARTRSVSSVAVELPQAGGRPLSPSLRTVREEANRRPSGNIGDELLGVPPPRRSAAGGGSGGGAGAHGLPFLDSPFLASGEGGAAAVAEGWDALPGTPGNTQRGGTLAAGMLRALGGAGGSNSGPVDAALAYCASVQHTAALLNEPPAALHSAAAAAVAAGAAYTRSPISSAGTTAAVGAAVAAAASCGGGPMGLGSPRLVLPPTSSAGRSLAATAPSPVAGPGSFGRVSALEAEAAASGGGGVASPVHTRPDSNRGAAARLFGGYAAGAALLESGGGAGGTSSPVSTAVQPQPLQRVGSLSPVTAAAAAGAAAGALPAARMLGSPAASPSAIQLLPQPSRWAGPAAKEDEIKRYIGSFSHGGGATESYGLASAPPDAGVGSGGVSGGCGPPTSGIGGGAAAAPIPLPRSVSAAPGGMLRRPSTLGPGLTTMASSPPGLALQALTDTGSGQRPAARAPL